MYSLALGATSCATRKAVSMYAVPVILNHFERRNPSGSSASITSLTTSQQYTSSLKCETTSRMCFCSLARTKALFSALGTRSVPASSLKTHSGVCRCHTRVCPRIRMWFARANATRASAAVKFRSPRLCSSDSHFIAFSAVMLLKCFLRSSPCGPEMSPTPTAAPTAKYGFSTSRSEGMSCCIESAAVSTSLAACARTLGTCKHSANSSPAMNRQQRATCHVTLAADSRSLVGASS